MPRISESRNNPTNVLQEFLALQDPLFLYGTSPATRLDNLAEPAYLH
jgi:hypothetical protein